MFTATSGVTRVDSLDGIRAVAITLVVLVHAFEYPPGGGVGVDLFFVLSGFLITSILLEERARTGRISLSGFYARRARRLLPALCVMLAVVFLWVGWLPVLAGLGYFSNVLLAAEADFPPALWHLWSLAQEEQFYIVWPLLLLLVSPRLIMLAITLSTIYLGVLLATSDWQRAYFDPLAHAAPILAGCLLAIVGVRSSRIAYAAPLLLLLLLFAPEFSAIVPGVLILASLAGVGLIVAALDGGPIARALALTPLVFLGRISYSLYLWHMPVLVAFDNDLVAVGAALVLATLSYYLIERRFTRPRKLMAVEQRDMPQSDQPSRIRYA